MFKVYLHEKLLYLLCLHQERSSVTDKFQKNRNFTYHRKTVICFHCTSGVDDHRGQNPPPLQKSLHSSGKLTKILCPPQILMLSIKMRHFNHKIINSYCLMKNVSSYLLSIFHQNPIKGWILKPSENKRLPSM